MGKKFDINENDYHREESPEPCVHSFEKYNGVIKEYRPEICDWVIEHGRQGLFIEGFSGRYSVCTDAICSWLSEPETYPEFCAAVKSSISACIFYWNEECNHAMKSLDWQGFTAIRGILENIMKSTPKQLREGLFNQYKPLTADEIEAAKKAKAQQQLLNDMTGGNGE